MRIDVLGPLRVVDADGREVTPRGAQQRRALTALAVAAPSPVSAERLAEVLWPAGAPSANALQAQVSKLRKVVAPGGIESGPSGYRLTGVETDLRCFEERVAAGDLAAADALVRGPAVADLDDAWGAAQRVRIDAMVRSAAAARLDGWVATEPDRAVAELEQRVIGEPVDERWWALLMRAHAHSGRQAEALRTFARARTALAEELGLEPGPELRLLEQEVLQQTVSSPVSPRRGRPNLPERLSSVIGREGFVSEVAAIAACDRLVTLVGPGGVGKTTAALLVARRRADDGGAGWCELAAVDDRDGVIRQIGGALGLPESGRDTLAGGGHVDDPIDRIVDALAAAPTTLVLDNCEHVIDVAADVAQQVLAAAADVHIIATSRQPLGVPGERVVAIPPLERAAAIELLIDRARHHDAAPAAFGDGGVPDGSLLDVVCARLDDLPLAIELAAARLRAMTLAELHDRLDDRFAVLDAGARTADPRQRTLWAVVDWSYELLDPIERRMLERLSVFVGGTTIEGVVAVAGGLAAAQVDTAVAQLVDKSLVVATVTPWGMRYRLLDTIGDYAAARLTESGERDEVVADHARFMAELVAPAERGLVGHGQAEWFTRLSTERGNLDAALAASMARGDGATALAIAAPLGWYFYMLGELALAAELFGEILALPGTDDPRQRALALSHRAWQLVNGPEIHLAQDVSKQAVALLDDVDDPWAAAIIRNYHVMVTLFSGRLDLLPGLLDDARLAAAGIDDDWIRGITTLVEAEAHEYRGRIHAAADSFALAARHFEACGDRFAHALTIGEQADLSERFGEYDRAIEVIESGLALADEIGFSALPLTMRVRLGNLEILRGNLAAAEAHHRSLLDDSDTAGLSWVRAFARWGLAAVARRQGEFEAAARHLDLAWSDPRTQRVPHNRSLILVAQGYLADQIGDGATALERQLEAFELALGLGAPLQIAYSLEGCAGALALHDDPAAARLGASLLGHADLLRRRHAVAMPAAERYDVDRAEQRLRDRLGGTTADACGDDDRAGFDTEFAAGADTDLDELRRSLAGFTP